MTRSRLQMARHANRNATVDMDNRHFTGDAVVILDSQLTQAEVIAERLREANLRPRAIRPSPTIRKFSWQEKDPTQ